MGPDVADTCCMYVGVPLVLFVVRNVYAFYFSRFLFFFSQPTQQKYLPLLSCLLFHVYLSCSFKRKEAPYGRARCCNYVISGWCDWFRGRCGKCFPLLVSPFFSLHYLWHIPVNQSKPNQNWQAFFEVVPATCWHVSRKWRLRTYICAPCGPTHYDT